MNEAYQECTRFQRCAVNKCPLDSNYKQMLTHAGDAERKCTLPRRKRVEIGNEYDNLAYGGLTGHEYTALRETGNLPLKLANAERNARVENTDTESGVQA